MKPLLQWLSVQLDQNGNPVVHGGNAVFNWNGPAGVLDFVPGADWATGGCEISCRYGFMDAIHFNNGAFHLDTAGVQWGYGLGAFLHLVINYGFGNINSSTPLMP